MKWRFLMTAAVSITMPASAQRFGFDASGRPGTIAVRAQHGFDGRYGFEPGRPDDFSIALSEGNYRVTVELKGGRDGSETSIWAEDRRLVMDRVTVAPRRTRTISVVVNVRNAMLPPPPGAAPGGDGVRLTAGERRTYSWDDRLTLELPHGRSAIDAITIVPASVPTLFLLGDSTVTDQPFHPASSWGQMLPAFVDDRIAVANHAWSGETLKSFLTALRLDKVLSQVKPGDWAMIQFGHNDQKFAWPQTHAPADSTFRDYLRTYITEFHRRDAHPVLVTSPERRNWTGDRIRPTIADYAAATRAVAAETHTPLIDLHRASIAFYEALGLNRAPLAFNDGGKDATHHNDYGAWVLARAIAEMMRTATPDLAGFLRPDLGSFDPSHPPLPETFHLPTSGVRGSDRPAGS